MNYKSGRKKPGIRKHGGRRLCSPSYTRGAFKGTKALSQNPHLHVKRPPYIVLSFTPGLASWVKQELLESFQELSAGDIKPVFGRKDELMVSVPGISIRHLLEMRTVSQIFVAQSFSVNRPSGLLSPEHLRDIARTLSQCLKNNPHAKSFRLDAAGKNSTTMQRLADKLFVATGLQYDPEEGEILLRIRPTPGLPQPEPLSQSDSRSRFKGENILNESYSHSWEVLTRVSLLPLSARDWRVANYRGALDATVAAAICRSLGSGAKENFLNLMCGSATLLIERALLGPANQIIGVEISEEALRCAADNVAAARLNKRIKLYQDDVLKVRLDESSFNSIVVNFPWGEALGKKSALPALYSMTLERVDELAATGAKLAILSQRDDLVLSLITDKLKGWRLIEQQQIFQGGFTPTLFILGKAVR